MTAYTITVDGNEVAWMASRFRPESEVLLDGAHTPFQFAASGCRTVRMAELLLEWAHGQGWGLCKVDETGAVVGEVGITEKVEVFGLSAN